MNTREELLEVMARAANKNKWQWLECYDNPGLPEYNMAQGERYRSITDQERALEAIEAKGARVVPLLLTDRMADKAAFQISGVASSDFAYDAAKDTWAAAIDASPFAPEKKL